MAGSPGAASCVVGSDADGGVAGLLNDDLGSGNNDAVLIDYGESDSGTGGRGDGESSGKKELSERRGQEADGEATDDQARSTPQTNHGVQCRRLLVGRADAEKARQEMSFVIASSLWSHEVYGVCMILSRFDAVLSRAGGQRHDGG